MKYLYISILSILLIGCQATGIKPISNAELNGTKKPAVIVQPPKVVTVIIPKKTNTLVVPVQEVKKAVDNNEPLKLNIVSDAVTNTIILESPAPEVVGKNFLAWWYGTIIIGILIWFAYFAQKKFFRKKKTEKIVDNSTDSSVK